MSGDYDLFEVDGKLYRSRKATVEPSAGLARVPVPIDPRKGLQGAPAAPTEAPEGRRPRGGKPSGLPWLKRFGL